ncbi:I78 family peptidase inhibitor [Streptomyces sp. MST-110588]|uniref:I78 family peptidase inhibitor n=1 Tax=Streptomyces sp. MST-110588 TaxID=2833628 RepID=UPI001F5DF7AD|nr:I78 family peptidase inhibitor [Streptomyces sp. MST-110588]UNO42873.1 proteinase inhibitor I78 [Streptomyces sp. MST-110588]
MAPVPNPPYEPQDDPETYVGLAQEEAEEQARARGWNTVRSLPPGTIITMEYLGGRLNFEVKDGVVQRSWKG